jgi:ABC-2 type transport system ATP-binding protein
MAAPETAAGNNAALSNTHPIKGDASGSTVACSNAGPAIEAIDLRKNYRSGLLGRKNEALKDVTLSVKRGEVFGLLGPNGAGKTTFVKILLGIISKTSGNARLMGCPAGSIAGRAQVGYLPEHLRISPHLTALKTLELYGNLSNVPTSTIRDRQNDLLSLVGLKGREKESVRNFSKGMLQRLGLAQSLLHDPKLLMLDEPTDGLDPRARAEMRAIINRLRESGVTIFLNSHLLQEVEMICDSVAILDRGGLRFCGDVTRIGEAVTGAGEEIVADVELKCQSEQFDLVAANFRHQITDPRNDHQVNARFEFSNQSEVDQFIDSVRQNKISLIRFSPQKLNLEEAFLKLIQE